MRNGYWTEGELEAFATVPHEDLVSAIQQSSRAQMNGMTMDQLLKESEKFLRDSGLVID